MQQLVERSSIAEIQRRHEEPVELRRRIVRMPYAERDSFMPVFLQNLREILEVDLRSADKMIELVRKDYLHCCSIVEEARGLC